MSLSTVLLSQARFLISKEPKRPKQASLRRAVSAAYYALFHLLVEDGVRVTFGGADARDLRSVVGRAFNHGSMKTAARGFASGNPAAPWRSLQASLSADLKFVADTFVELQHARHQADYDLARRFDRADVSDLVDKVDRATLAWRRLRRPDANARSLSFEARVFLAALLLNDKIAGRG